MEPTRTSKSGNNETRMGFRRALFPHTHSHQYLMHKFWSRKPHNIIANYISSYSTTGETILDPFGGSGVTFSEALHLNRRAVHVDLNPLSCFVTRNTNSLLDPSRFMKKGMALLNRVKAQVPRLYETSCMNCQGTGEITHILWKDVIRCTNNHEIDYNGRKHGRKDEFTCKECGETMERSTSRHSIPFLLYYRCTCSTGSLTKVPGERDIHSIHELQDVAAKMDGNVVLENLRELLVHDSGKPFLQLRHGMRDDPRLINLFSSRNLIALLMLHQEINQLPEGNVLASRTKEMMQFTLSSNLPQCSKMVWIIKKRKKEELDRYEVGSWTHHFLWNPTEFFEVNAFRSFQTRLKKICRGLKHNRAWMEGSEAWSTVAWELPVGNWHLPDGGIRWLGKKRPSNPTTLIKMLQECKASAPNIAPNAGAFFKTQEFNGLLLERSSESLPSVPTNSIDYIFTDPPYGDSLQYLELSTFFLAWLPGFSMREYLNERIPGEIVVNRNQEKGLEQYQEELTEVFRECARVLKKNHFMTITFHNTDFKYRNCIFQSCMNAGFTLDHVVYQPPARASEKSLLHKFGSPTGDYIITFQNNEHGIGELLVATEKEMEEVLAAVFAERGEPVPFPYLLGLVDIGFLSMDLIPPPIDRNLHGFLEDNPSFSWKEGQGWFFSDDGIKKWKTRIKEPLSTRVEVFLQACIASIPEGITPTMEVLVNVSFARFNGLATPSLENLKRMVRSLT